VNEPQPIKPGSDARRNWKTINQLIDQQKLLGTQRVDHGGGIAELRKRQKDTVATGSEIELTDCSTGIIYLVRGRVKPDEEE
jgi:hypothetical protein